METDTDDDNESTESRSDGTTEEAEPNVGDYTETGNHPPLIMYEAVSVREPYVGMEFESEVHARSFYNAYAKRVGFGVRVNYSHRSRRDRTMIAQQYVCAKEGFRRNREGARKRHRASTRVGCNAMMIVNKMSSGKWGVKNFEKEHNHPLVNPNQVQFLRSPKDVLDSRSLKIDKHRLAERVSGSAVLASNVQLCSSSNASFTDRNCKNYVLMDRQRSFAIGDAQTVLDYLKCMQNENPSFFYAVQVDKEDRLTNVFWVDAASKMAYGYFGDLITFDTTFLMNKFRMPFIPFVGVNHHGQSVLLGCALLADETRSSFAWLFKTWLAAMSGRHPISIITDQDRAIQAAVAEVFPRTHHRFCLSYILRKLPDKLAHVCRMYRSFKEEFQKCIYHTKSIDEFELSWYSLLDTFDLRNNEWLQLLYVDRQYWAPVYLKGAFFADTFTTQRIECMNTFFNGCMNAQTSVEEFFMLYNNALDNQYYKEVRADFDTMYTTPSLKTSSPMEKQVASHYTREIFKKFQVELFECFGYIANKIADDGAIGTYMVAKYGEEKKPHTVTFSVSETRGNCSCQMFERMGILCRHILNVFKVTNVFTLPSHYILKRWTKNAKSTVMLDEHGVKVQGNSRQSMILRYNDLCHRSIKFADEGARSTESYNVAVHALQRAFGEVVNVNDCVAGLPQPSTMVSGSNYHDGIIKGSQVVGGIQMAQRGPSVAVSQCSTQDKFINS